MKMTLQNNSKMISEKGFSLVEKLVAITITTILIGFASGIYLLGQRFFLQWRNQLNLHNELHTLSHGITEELFRADRIKNLKPQKLILQNEGRERKYEAINDSLFVNDKNILSSSLSLLTFKLSARDDKENLITGSDPNKIGDITFVELTLALTDGKDTLTTSRGIHLRKPSNWNELTSNGK